MIPSQFRVKTVDDFIGPARKQADFISKLISQARENDRAPIKLIILGKPGIGKSELAEHFVREAGGNKWNSHKYNGTQFKIDDSEDLSHSCHYTNLHGDYGIIRIEEVDKVPTVAQVRLLTLLDDLPDGNAFVCTSNCGVHDLEERFQRRFVVMQLVAPKDYEIERFLIDRFTLAPQSARQIATFCCGNVGQALMDATLALASA